MYVCMYRHDDSRYIYMHHYLFIKLLTINDNLQLQKVVSKFLELCVPTY